MAAACLVAPAAAAGAPVPAPGARAHSVPAPRCSLPGARTIAANRHVRVFSARVRTWREVFGCRRSANRAFAIGDAGDECQNYDLVDSAVVAGALVALNVRTCSLTSSSSVVKLVDLGDGRVRFGAPPMPTDGTDASYDAIRGMVVTPAGRLAWIGVRVARGVVIEAEVRRRIRATLAGTFRLDTGTGIDPRSLRRSGSIVMWRHDGVQQRAGL